MRRSLLVVALMLASAGARGGDFVVEVEFRRSFLESDGTACIDDFDPEAARRRERERNEIVDSLRTLALAQQAQQQIVISENAERAAIDERYVG